MNTYWLTMRDKEAKREADWLFWSAWVAEFEAAQESKRAGRG